MMRPARAARRHDDGFSLVEIMVVVLIIAILIAIAIPTFLAARTRANDRAMQSMLRTALVAEKTYFTDNQVYTDDAAVLGTVEGSPSYVTNAVAGASATTPRRCPASTPG